MQSSPFIDSQIFISTSKSKLSMRSFGVDESTASKVFDDEVVVCGWEFGWRLGMGTGCLELWLWQGVAVASIHGGDDPNTSSRWVKGEEVAWIDGDILSLGN
ncbi:hypothetical protein Droror1_Dr00016295 [Drosera rotundifolia]